MHESHYVGVSCQQAPGNEVVSTLKRLHRRSRDLSSAMCDASLDGLINDTNMHDKFIENAKIFFFNFAINMFKK